MREIRGFLAGILSASIVAAGLVTAPVCAEASTTSGTVAETVQSTATPETTEAKPVPDATQGTQETTALPVALAEEATGEGDLSASDTGYIAISIKNMSDLVSALGASNVKVLSDTKIQMVKSIVTSSVVFRDLQFESGTYTIDFNGFRIGTSMCFGVSGADVTLLDSSAKQQGGITVTDFYSVGGGTTGYSAVSCLSGTLAILSGYYEASSSVIWINGGTAAISGGEFFVREVEFASMFLPAIDIEAKSSVQICGGVFHSPDGGLYALNFDYAGAVKHPLNLKISGGWFIRESTNGTLGGLTYSFGEITGTVNPADILADGSVLSPSPTYQKKDDFGFRVVTTDPSVAVGVDGFVYRLYGKALGRTPDYLGFDNWGKQLKAHAITGTNVAYGFFFSPEFLAKTLSDKDYVTLLYRVFFDREPDPTGLGYWQKILSDGCSRNYVFAGFANSSEWKSLCQAYAIDPGSYAPSEARDQNAQVTAFVQRLYTLCLGRPADIAGLNNWTAQLNGRTSDGARVAYGFFFSAEFQNRKLTNAAYVDLLYQVLLGRTADTAGRNAWVSKLQAGTSRLDIFRGFVGSAEFDQICTGFGIVRGSV